ncbi:MAG: VOC family protein [Acidobacteriia bacterium]|nr:VOC family protein [Terriglobia bacterium]
MANTSTKTHYIPAGYQTVTPYLIVRNAAKALDWYKSVLGAVEEMRFPMPDGKIGHAEIKFGDSHVMLADEFPEMNAVSPETVGGTASAIMIYVEDVDSVFHKAVANGAKVKQDLQDKFYGDRNATIYDPFGHQWTIATHVEDVSPEEMQRRMAAMQK